MDSPHILILDQNLDRADQLKNKIINTGIICRIFVSGTQYELDFHLQDLLPAVVIACSDALPSSDAHATVDLLSARQVPLLFVFEPENTGFLDAVLRKQACQIVSLEEEYLCGLIRDYLERQSRLNVSKGEKDPAEDVNLRFQRLLEHTQEAVAYIHQGLHVNANPAYLDCFQLDSSADLEGLSLLDLMKGVDVDLKTLLKNIGRDVFPRQPVTVKILSSADQHNVAELSFQPVRYRQESCAQVILRVPHRPDLQGQPHFDHGAIDPLTRMMTRDTFLPRLANYLAKSERPFKSNAMLYLEPDGFEDYQDTLGHIGADEFLADFAATVRSFLNRDDMACRFTDHAIVVLLRREDESPLDNVAHSILEAMAEHSVVLDHVSLNTRCSIGLLPLSPSMSCADEAIRQARTAYRKAKEQGQSLVRYKPTLSMVALDAVSEAGWQERLSFGLEHGNFYSLQLSINHLEDESRSLVETRTYLREDDGDIDQREFLDAADACQLGAELDRAVIPSIFEAIGSRPGDQRHLLTISATSVQDNSFAPWLVRLMTESPVDPGKILLQISAPSILDHRSRASLLAQELRKLGCGMVLTEFDHEPKYLKMASDLGVSLIKLSETLTRAMIESEEERDRVRALVQTASGVGFEVMVEGIRSTSQLAILWQAGIKLVGGEFLQESSEAAS